MVLFQLQGSLYCKPNNVTSIITQNPRIIPRSLFQKMLSSSRNQIIIRGKRQGLDKDIRPDRTGQLKSLGFYLAFKVDDGTRSLLKLSVYN